MGEQGSDLGSSSSGGLAPRGGFISEISGISGDLQSETFIGEQGPAVDTIPALGGAVAPPVLIQKSGAN